MLNQQKKMYKVVCAIDKKSGGQYWMRCGTAYENRDESINCYLDVYPKDMKFQIRALDEEDLRKINERRESNSLRSSSGVSSSVASSSGFAGSSYGSNRRTADSRSDAVPFDPSMSLPHPSETSSLTDVPF